MNTIDILYQVFRARYSLASVQDALDEGYKLALIGVTQDELRNLREWMGEPRIVEGHSPPSRRLVELTADEVALDHAELKSCTAAVIHLGKEMPSPERLLEIGKAIPYQLACLWVVEALPSSGPREERGGLPHVYQLDPVDPGAIFCRLLTRCFPSLAIGVARDYRQVRQIYAQRLISKAARRNSMLAMASSIAVPPIPGVQFVWGFFATTGETMAITASQLRLCLIMAALHGRPLDFFDRVGELWPIIGGAFGWRTLAREAIGRIPAAGWAMKSSMAYSGTWLVGEGSRLFYENGQPTDAEMVRELKRLSRRTAEQELAKSLASLGQPVVDAAEKVEEAIVGTSEDEPEGIDS